MASLITTTSSPVALPAASTIASASSISPVANKRPHLADDNTPWHAAATGSARISPVPLIHHAPVLRVAQDDSPAYALTVMKHSDPIREGLAMDAVAEAAEPECIVPRQQALLWLLGLKNFFKRSKKQITLHGIDGSHLDQEKKVCKFFESKNLFWIELLDDIVKTSNHSGNQVSEKEAARLWGSICCYPNIKDVPQDSLPMLNKLICSLDRLLEVEEENVSGLANTTWKSLLGATLSSYHELLWVNVSTSSELGLFLSLAKRHSACPQVLSSVAEYLDSLHGAACLGIIGEFDPQNLLDLLRIFGVNLSSPNKHVRVLTLRILSYFMKMDQRLGSDEEQPHKRQRTKDSREETVDAKYTNIPACTVF